ncbi:MAG: PAS domain S-box protein [Proteobacteria bacterium]|nr:PAS domain S-box protein [Pseudomonadota bacterium]MBU1709042.1 PAS domain S-box protein [Pseudomonadota bacterium]
MAKNDAELFILKDAVDNAGEAFITIDKDSTVLFFNKAAESVFGYSQKEVLGKPLANILGPACREGHEHAVRRYIQTGQGKLIGHTTEFLAMRKGGETFPAAISFSVARVNDALYFTGIVRDLSEQQNLQNKLINAERLAALGQTVAEITHEIKNPLTIIGGFARRLAKNEQNAQNAEKLNIIVSEVDRLENLLKGLKTYYTPQILNLKRFDLCRIIDEVHALVSDECRSKKIDLEIKLHDTCILIEGDEEKLKQVLINVVKNSIEASGDGGKLSIETRYVENTAEIAVRDSGPGIPEAMKKKIFEPFFTTKQQGTGLGLAVSKRIVEGHAGSSFTIESEEGRGTVVKIALTRY